MRLIDIYPRVDSLSGIMRRVVQLLGFGSISIYTLKCSKDGNIEVLSIAEDGHIAHTAEDHNIQGMEKVLFI